MLTDINTQRENLEKLLASEKARFDAMFEAETAWIRDLLQNLSKNGTFKPSTPQTSIPFKKQNSTKIAKSDTFLGRVARILREADEPLTVKEMIDKINLISDKPYNYSRFSGTISAQYKKKRSLIKQEKILEFPLSHRYLYTLKEWYDENDKLKEEYWIKIQKRR